MVLNVSGTNHLDCLLLSGLYGRECISLIPIYLQKIRNRALEKGGRLSVKIICGEPNMLKASWNFRIISAAV